MDCHGVYSPDCAVCSGIPTGSRYLHQVQTPLQRPRRLHEEFVRVCSPLLCSLCLMAAQLLSRVHLCHKGESPQGKHAHALAMHAWPQLRPDGAVMRGRCHQAGTSSELLAPTCFFVLHAGWRLCGAPSVSLGFSGYPILLLGHISALALVLPTLNNQVGHSDLLWQSDGERGQQAQANHAKTTRRPSTEFRS